MGKRICKSSNKPLWLAERLKYVTASSIAAMLDESKYTTRADLLAQKLGLQAVDTNEHMWWGSHLEEPILKGLRLCPQSPFYECDIRPCGWLYADTDSKHHTRLAATPDAWIHGERIEHITHGDCYSYDIVEPSTKKVVTYLAYAPKIPLQLKISRFPWKTPPADYRYQVQCEMACTSTDAAFLVQFHGNWVANVHFILRNESFINRIRNESVWFMDMVRQHREKMGMDAGDMLIDLLTRAGDA